MTGFDSKRQAAQAKVQEEMQAVFTKRQAERDKLQDEPDTLLIVYQRGFADGKAAAQPEQEPTCPKCKAAVLYECVACSNNNYPPRPEQEPCIGKDPRCPCQDGGACHYKDCGNTKAWSVPQAEPTPWRDMVVVTLVREGINKHRARELADHFAAQPAQEPVVFKIYLPKAPRQDVNHGMLPWVYDQDPSSGNVASMWVTPFKATPPQRPWVGLTDEDKKKIATAAGCTEDDDGHIVTEIFRLAEAKLKERNYV